VDLALRLGQIDSSLPWIKSNAVWLLTRPYTNDTEALQDIATSLANEYPNGDRLNAAIASVQQIYLNNFFPQMKANWRDYPDNIGHKIWPGCTRCHDNQHHSLDGKQTITFKDCHQCHLILAQGSGAQLEKLDAHGFPFEHPGGDNGDMQCSDCHSGGP
jgi:hypothetical protein